MIPVKQIDPDFFIPNRFAGKSMLITGAARGIGQAVAFRAAREGANVVVADWLPQEGAETVEKIQQQGGKAAFVEADIRQTEDCDRMVMETIRSFGSLDYVVNNAGVMTAVYSGEPFDWETQQPLLPETIHEATDEYFEGVLAINIIGLFKSLRAELRQMVAQGKGGAIVNVGSVTGLRGFGSNPAYVSSKHGVTGLTKNAAIDYAIHGIRVNSVNMGTTVTPMLAMAKEWLEARHKAGKSNNPVSGYKTKNILELADPAHLSSVWEQASVILFLLSDEASDLTGLAYPTDGGFSSF